MPAYIQGSLIRVSAVFLVNSAPTDPTTIVLKFKNPTGTITTWTFGTDNQVVKESLGTYRADINANVGGTWLFRWEGTGAAQAADQGTFDVTAATIA